MMNERIEIKTAPKILVAGMLPDEVLEVILNDDYLYRKAVGCDSVKGLLTWFDENFIHDEDHEEILVQAYVQGAFSRVLPCIS